MNRKGTLHIIRISRDIDDLYLSVLLADSFCRLDAIDHRHIYVQKEDVILPFAPQKLRSI